MNSKQKTEFKVGVTVFMAVIVLVMVIGWAKGISVFSDEKELQIAFDQVPGLEVGDIVTVRGVRSGKVAEIKPADENVIVKVNLMPEVKLKTDAKFSIMMLDLMGGKKMEISPGQGDEPLDFTVVQNGYFLGDISTAMAMLSSVQSDLVTLIHEVKITLTSVNEIMGQGELKEQIYSSINNLDHLTTTLTSVVKENQTQIKELLASSTKLTENANTLIDDNSEKLTQIFTDVESAIKSSNDLLTRINGLVDETKAGDNNLGKIMYDENLLKEINSNLSQLRELSKIVLDQLKEKGLKVDAYIF